MNTMLKRLFAKKRKKSLIFIAIALVSSACATTLVLNMQERWHSPSNLRITTVKGGAVADIIDDCSESLTYANVTEAMLPCIKRQTIVAVSQDLSLNTGRENEERQVIAEQAPAGERLSGDSSEDEFALIEKPLIAIDDTSESLTSVNANPSNSSVRQTQAKQKAEQLNQAQDFASRVTYPINTSGSLFALNTLGTQSKPLNQSQSQEQDQTNIESSAADNKLNQSPSLSHADTNQVNNETKAADAIADSSTDANQVVSLVNHNEQLEITDNLVLSGNVVNNGIININQDSLLTLNGTLGGSGVFNGLTLVQDSSIAPGNSPGLITFDDLIWQDIELNIELAGSDQAGVDYDAIQVNGDLQVIGSVDIFIDQTVDFDLEGTQFSILTVNGNILNESGLVVNDPSILDFNIDESFDLNWLKEAEGWSLTLLASLNPLNTSNKVSEPWPLLLFVLAAIWSVASRRASQRRLLDLNPSH
jgi:hypothetical protein